MTQEVQQKQKEILDKAQADANETIEQAQQLKKENDELQEQIKVLQTKNLLHEKLKFTTLKSDSVEQIEELFEGRAASEEEITQAISRAEHAERRSSRFSRSSYVPKIELNEKVDEPNEKPACSLAEQLKRNRF